MSRTLQQILDAGGSDPALFSAAAQLVGLGTMLTPQNRTLTLASLATIKLSDIDPSIPGVRVGGIAKGMAYASFAQLATDCAVCIGTPAQVVPSGTAGLSVGSSNGIVRVQAKDGFVVRYAQFSGSSLITSGAGSRASQSLAVFVTGAGQVVEIWVQLATNAGGTATSTANQVIAAIKASALAMRALAAVDSGAGTGASTAQDIVDPGVNPAYGPFIAAGMSSAQTSSPGQFLASHDGNLLAFVAPITAVTLDYIACPRVPLEEPYPGSL